MRAIQLLLVLLSCGVAVLDLLALLNPGWIVVRDAQLGALPYTSSTTLAAAAGISNASAIVVSEYTLGTLRYCAGAGTCRSKLDTPELFATESSCGRTAADIRGLYYAVAALLGVGALCALLGGLFTARPMLSRDPAGVRESAAVAAALAAAATEPRNANANTTTVASSPDHHQQKGTSSQQPTSVVSPPPAVRSASQSPIDHQKQQQQHQPPPPIPAWGTPRLKGQDSPFGGGDDARDDVAANRMSMQVNSDDDVNVVVIQPTVVAQREHAELLSVVRRTAKRGTLRRSIPAIFASLCSIVATVLIVIMHETFLHCGSSTVDALKDSITRFSSSSAAATSTTPAEQPEVVRGLSYWVLVGSGGGSLLALICIPLLVSAAQSFAAAQFEDPDGEPIDGAATLPMGNVDVKTEEVTPSRNNNNSTNGRSPPAAAPLVDHSNVLLEPARSPPVSSRASSGLDEVPIIEERPLPTTNNSHRCRGEQHDTLDSPQSVA